MTKKRLSTVFGFLYKWCSGIDKYRPDIYMGIRVKGRKLFFCNKSDYEKALDYLYSVKVDYDILNQSEYYEKSEKYHLRCIHYPEKNEHNIIIRDFFYDSITDLKKAAECLSKYQNVVCEVIND